MALVILDGWGVSQRTEANAIAAAHTPNYDHICRTYPWTTLKASGQEIGLRKGQPGNAETGHMNLGAGRVVKSDLCRIEEAVRNGKMDVNDILQRVLASAVSRGANVHLIGLLSDADVHSSMETLYAILRAAKRIGAVNVFVHGILDGRDVPPRTADVYIEALEIKLADIGIGRIATLCGRFFAMDSSEQWERTARAFTMLVHAEGERVNDAVTAVRSSFLRGISDEFVSPIVIESEPGVPVATIRDGDLVIFFNHRSDTMRQIVRSLAVPDRGLIVTTSKPAIEAICLTEYDRAFGLPVLFPPVSEPNSLAEIFAEHSITNYRISETERFAHVGRFFNCGAEQFVNCEQRIEIEAKSAIREAEPEMRSFKIADAVINHVEEFPNSIVIANFPAPGLLAETGSFERTIEAVQYVDTCLGGIIEAVTALNGVVAVTSTHGNCEEMSFTNGEPHRFATLNPVPFHLIDPAWSDVALRHDGVLQDVAPTLLALLGMKKPKEMTGSDLRMA